MSDVQGFTRLTTGYTSYSSRREGHSLLTHSDGIAGWTDIATDSTQYFSQMTYGCKSQEGTDSTKFTFYGRGCDSSICLRYTNKDSSSYRTLTKDSQRNS